MFTGIIEERGTVTAIAPSGDGVRLTVHAPLAVSDAHQGDSISISGVCLTVVDQGDDWFTADSSPTRLGGHIVQGHVDGTGEVLEVRPGAQWQVIRFRMPRELAPLVVDKGSITVDGVSLTVSAVSPAGPSTSSGATSTTSGTSPSTGSGTTDWFEVSLIPETLEVTTLGARTVGDRVNLETDILARHVQRLLAFTTINEGGSR